MYHYEFGRFNIMTWNYQSKVTFTLKYNCFFGRQNLALKTEVQPKYEAYLGMVYENQSYIRV